MVQFLKAANTSEERPYITDDSVDEFLGWYRLDVATPVAEHITLARNGLYKLVPELQLPSTSHLYELACISLHPNSSNALPRHEMEYMHNA